MTINAGVQQAIKYYSREHTIYRQDTTNPTTGWNATTGKYNNANRVPVTLQGAVINSTGADTKLVLEGERTEGMVTLYTMDEIYETDEEAQRHCDILYWSHTQKYYRVLKVLRREIGGFTKAICGIYPFKVSANGLGSGFGTGIFS